MVELSRGVGVGDVRSRGGGIDEVCGRIQVVLLILSVALFAGAGGTVGSRIWGQRESRFSAPGT